KARAATVLSRCGAVMPRAVGATPAGEGITFDPDQTFIHTSTFCACVLGFVLGRGRAEHINRSSAGGGLLPAREYFPRSPRNQVTKVLRPRSNKRAVISVRHHPGLPMI